MANRKPANRSPARGLLRIAISQFLWAIPFALFFGTLFGSTPGAYLHAYKMSLVFAFTIGLFLWVTTHFIEPRLGPDEEADTGGWVVGSWYVGMAVFGSYLAAVIIHFTVEPGFLGSWRSLAVSTMFTMIFVGLFGAASFARHFYLKAVDRARAVEQARAELAQAELRALKAQINPHFLFNTLNSIASLIAVNPAAAEETTTQLADAFRYTLRASDQERVRFADELQFLRTVLAIERTRFGDRLRIVEDIEQGLDAFMVPSLLLQPVVENAVRHGATARVEGGTVRISARRAGSLLEVVIADDGPGIDPTALPKGAGFGLHSVRERLRVAGPPHALEIVSPPTGGTEVHITLPVHHADAAQAPPVPGERS
ncbi:MAG: histidine kinase [Candidatus Eisenbacteria bacterium]